MNWLSEEMMVPLTRGEFIVGVLLAVFVALIVDAMLALVLR